MDEAMQEELVVHIREVQDFWWYNYIIYDTLYICVIMMDVRHFQKFSEEDLGGCRILLEIIFLLDI